MQHWDSSDTQMGPLREEVGEQTCAAGAGDQSSRNPRETSSTIDNWGAAAKVHKPVYRVPACEIGIAAGGHSEECRARIVRHIHDRR